MRKFKKEQKNFPIFKFSLLSLILKSMVERKFTNKFHVISFSSLELWEFLRDIKKYLLRAEFFLAKNLF